MCCQQIFGCNCYKTLSVRAAMPVTFRGKIDLIRLIATVADAFLLSTSPCVPLGSNTELVVGDTILDNPKSASFRCPEASGKRLNQNKIIRRL